MRRTIIMTGAGFIFCAISVAGAAENPALTKLHGHVPAVVTKLKPLGPLPADTNLNLSIGLPLHNCAELTNLLQQIYDPSSTNYHHFLSPEQFTAKFGPTEQDYLLVQNFAKVNGLEITGTHSNRMLLDVRGRASAVQKAFNVNLRRYHHPKENRDFFAPDAEPAVPSILPVVDVTGLDNLRRPKPHITKSMANSVPLGSVHPSAAPAPSATTGSGPYGTYMGDDFRTAYAPGVALQGSGQTVALVQFDGYYLSDIQAYESAAGRTNIPLQNVLLDGFSGAPSGTGGDVEVALDIEMLVAMAPALAKIVVYEGDPFNFHPNDVLNRIATDNSARQVSCSWGWTGGPRTSTDQIFQQMALQGQSFFTASGDSDAYPAGTVDDPSGFGTPSDSPYVTSVGGTTLTMSGTGTAYASETVWNWDIRYGSGYDGVGSSGGFSSYYSIPAWQTNVNMVARGGSATTRNFPDVALTADDVYEIAGGGYQIYGQGGTSCAAPLWAGFMALVNQQATNNGNGSVGFLNPAIYNIAAGASYNQCFHDITTGDNKWSGSPNLFPATNNYDLCTGLGTPNGANLINALATVAVTNGLTHLSPPPPPYGSTLSALNGKNPNGSWQLYVLDDEQFNTGVISNGWVLNLTTGSPIGDSADLALGMTLSSGLVGVSNNVAFTLMVTNYGPSTSSNVLVSDTLPAGATVVSSSADQGSITQSGLLLHWNVGNLITNAGSKAVYTLRFNSPGTYLDYASVEADTPDANPADDFVSTNIVVAVLTPPQISANATGGKFQLTVGNNAGASVVIQASTNLQTWVPVFTNLAPFVFTNFDTTNFAKRFYRAVTQ
ncbi:MAG TPA: protease pro-enzyme activation domain-containing protein [Verrucomicrobiae bacterium]